MCSLLPRTNIIRHCPWGGHQRDDWRMEWYWWRIPFDKVTFSLSLSRLLSLLTCHEIVRVLLGDRLALENSKLEHTLSHHVTIPNSQSTQEVSPLSSKCGHVHRCRYGESSMFSPRSLSVCVCLPVSPVCSFNRSLTRCVLLSQCRFLVSSRPCSPRSSILCPCTVTKHICRHHLSSTTSCRYRLASTSSVVCMSMSVRHTGQAFHRAVGEF